jgi:hypothetical protein
VGRTADLNANVAATLGHGADVINVGYADTITVGTSGTGQDTFVFSQSVPGTIGAFRSPTSTPQAV